MNEQLLTALIAAGAALLGALVGQLGPITQQRLIARQERRKVLRERYEQLALHVSETVALKGYEHLIMERPETLVNQSFKAHALAVVYFPELVHVTDNLAAVATALCVSAKESDSFREYDLDFVAAFEACITARRAVQDALKTHARRYT